MDTSHRVVSDTSGRRVYLCLMSFDTSTALRGKERRTTWNAEEKRTLEVVELMGWSYICMRNPWKKEALFQISQKKGESEVASS